MQVIVHTGAHHTDEDRLLKCLLRNKEDFAQRGVAVPGPGRYRPLLKETLRAMQTAPPAPDARDVLIDAILDEESADRLILSNPHFFGSQRFAVGKATLYPDAARRMKQLHQLFGQDQIEMFMAIRNPATFLPAVMRKAPISRFYDSMGMSDPREMRWSDTLIRVREAVPDAPLTIWCSEDAPLLWAQIIREMAGLDHGQKITGGFDLLGSIMSKEGMERFRTYLHQHPVMSEAQKRRVIAAFLDKYALDDAVEEELDLPGWTYDLVDELTDIYDEDVFRIQRIPGVQMLTP